MDDNEENSYHEFEHDDALLSLLFESISVYSRIRDAFVVLVEESKDSHEEYTNFTKSQMHFFSSRIQSLTLLLQNFQLWDADILMRTAIECATRFLFVSTRNIEERESLIREFNKDLFEIHLIERSEKAHAASRNTSDPEDAVVFLGAALTPEQEAELRARWPKSKRKPLKHKWSFSEIVPVLVQVKKPDLDLTAYGSLQYSYALGSHFIHADRTAMAVVQDRAMRGKRERALLERAHFARLAIEPTALFYICLQGMASATKTKVNSREFGESVHSLYQKSRPYHRDFFATQAGFYASAGIS